MTKATKRVVTFDGKEYELGITRAGVRAAEAEGLALNAVADKPQTSLDLLFYAALFGKHRMTFSKAQSILDSCLDSGELKFGEITSELTDEYIALFGLGESE